MTFPYTVLPHECKNSPSKLIKDGHDICPECWEEAKRHKLFRPRQTKAPQEKLSELNEDEVAIIELLIEEAQPPKMEEERQLGKKRKRQCHDCLMPKVLCDCEH